MLEAGGTILGILVLLCLVRAALGPLAADRLVAINTVGTKVIVLLALIAVILGEDFFLDVALVYALINFLDTVAISRYLETGSLL